MNSTREFLDQMHAIDKEAENARFIADLKTRNVLLACANTGIPPTALQMAELRSLYADCVTLGLLEYVNPLKHTNKFLNAK